MATREGRQVWLLVVAAAAAMLPVMALAQAADPATAPAPGITGMPQNVYDASVEALTKLAVIAIILEQALALIFDWKPFRETFDRKAVKPLVSFLFAAGIVNEFGLDVLHTLIDAYGGSPQGAGVLSKLVTALVLAGGSGGINRILQRLGVRTNLDAREEPIVAPTKAFVSVVPLLKDAKRTVSCVTIVGTDASGTSHSLGIVPGGSVGRDPTGVRAFFLQEKGRFPPCGGFPLEPGLWTIRLEAVDDAGAISKSADWGPYQLDAGTDIDLTLKV